MIGLRSKKPLDGIKQTSFIPGEIRKRQSRAVHIEIHREWYKNIKQDIKEILKSPSFAKYTTTGVIRLVPQYNWSQGKADENSKIRKCIIIQEQFQEQICSEEVPELENIDYKISSLKDVTLRECIMNIRKKKSKEKKLFVAVEKRWTGQGYDIYYPMVYKREALEVIKHLPYYLTQKHGTDIRRQFSTNIQNIIDTTVWDEKLEKAISAKDQELTDTTESYKEMAWMEFDESAEFGKNGSNNINITSSESDSDDSQDEEEYAMADNIADEVSTFQTKATKKKPTKKKVTNLDPSDDISAFTNTTEDTMETQIVNIETKFERLSTNLETLIEKSDIKRLQ